MINNKVKLSQLNLPLFQRKKPECSHFQKVSDQN